MTIESGPILPEGLQTTPDDLGKCLPINRAVTLADISSVTLKEVSPPDLDIIPQYYERQRPGGSGDTYRQQMVSFITTDGIIYHNVVPQDIDRAIDEPGETPFKQNGKTISAVLQQHSDVKYVVIYTWDFDSTPTNQQEVKDSKTLEVLEVK